MTAPSPPPDSVPDSSWKMNEETKRWVLEGYDGMNQASLLDQIEAAEGQQLLHYYLTFQDRSVRFYEIEYGLMMDPGSGSRLKELITPSVFFLRTSQEVNKESTLSN